MDFVKPPRSRPPAADNSAGTSSKSSRGGPRRRGPRPRPAPTEVTPERAVLEEAGQGSRVRSSALFLLPWVGGFGRRRGRWWWRRGRGSRDWWRRRRMSGRACVGVVLVAVPVAGPRAGRWRRRRRWGRRWWRRRRRRRRLRGWRRRRRFRGRRRRRRLRRWRGRGRLRRGRRRRRLRRRNGAGRGRRRCRDPLDRRDWRRRHSGRRLLCVRDIRSARRRSDYQRRNDDSALAQPKTAAGEASGRRDNAGDQREGRGRGHDEERHDHSLGPAHALPRFRQRHVPRNYRAAWSETDSTTSTFPGASTRSASAQSMTRQGPEPSGSWKTSPSFGS
jgi:hypothetical protein